jgi:Tfp pilus assembly protein PilF
MGAIENLEKMLAEGKDSALLRYGLADAYFKRAEYNNAVSHLKAAVEQDPDYSAAWKLLGKTLAEAGREKEAVRTFRQGIAVAERKGDVQAAREMKVFLKRLEKER